MCGQRDYAAEQQQQHAAAADYIQHIMLDIITRMAGRRVVTHTASQVDTWIIISHGDARPTACSRSFSWQVLHVYILRSRRPCGVRQRIRSHCRRKCSDDSDGRRSWLPGSNSRATPPFRPRGGSCKGMSAHKLWRAMTVTVTVIAHHNL